MKTIKEHFEYYQQQPIKLRAACMQPDEFYLIIAQSPNGDWLGWTSRGDATIVRLKDSVEIVWTLYKEQKKLLAWRLKTAPHVLAEIDKVIALEGMVRLMPEDAVMTDSYERIPALDVP